MVLNGGVEGGDGLVGFEVGQRRATTRLLDGDYPKVTSIFPTSVDTTAVISTGELAEAVKRVSLVAERNTPVRLRFTEGSVAIEAGTGDDAQASEAVECTLDGDEIDRHLQAAADRLDPRAGVLVRFVWMQHPDRTAPDLMWLVIHHLAVDGVSWRILLADLVTAAKAVAAATWRLCR